MFFEDFRCYMKKKLYFCTRKRVRSLAAPQQFNELIAFGLHRLCQRENIKD